MLEQSPTIPQTIADLFNAKFSHLSFHKPDLVNGVQTIYPYKDNSPKIFYLKKINLYEKMLLLKYFSAWGTYCEERRVVRKNNVLIDVANTAARMKERHRAFSRLHGPLREQRKLLQFQNVKIVGTNEEK